MNRVARVQVRFKATMINRKVKHAMIQWTLAMLHCTQLKYAVCHGQQRKRIWPISSRMCTLQTVWMAFISLRMMKIISALPTFNYQHARTMNEHKAFITNCWVIDMLKVNTFNFIIFHWIFIQQKWCSNEMAEKWVRESSDWTIFNIKIRIIGPKHDHTWKSERSLYWSSDQSSCCVHNRLFFSLFFKSVTV